MIVSKEADELIKILANPEQFNTDSSKVVINVVLELLFLYQG